MIEDFRHIKRIDDYLFEPQEIGKYTISVQGGRYHYCSPKEVLPSLHDYDCVEIAFWVTGDNPYLRPSDIPFEGMQRLDSDWSIYGEHPVGTYVSIDDARLFCTALRTLARMQAKNIVTQYIDDATHQIEYKVD